MKITSKYISLEEYITSGSPKISNFSINRKEISLNNEKDVLVKNEWISVDPYMRARMAERKNYLPPFELKKPMSGAAIGIVQKSNSKKILPGDIVLSENGWRDYFVEKDNKLQKIKNKKNFPIQTFLGPLGMTGHTAYIGLFKIGNLKKGQTVLVSSAGGAVGSMVCQIAKNLGCKVIASTGSDEKVQWLKDELKVDNAFNYKKVENLVLHLKSLSPEGYNLYFDNVGGNFLESAIYRMKNFGEIIICGRISQMNISTPGEGLKNMAHVLVKRLTIKGFLIFDHIDDKQNFQNDMTNWIVDKKIQWKETIVNGIENSPSAFIDLLNGKNIGKMLVKI